MNEYDLLYKCQNGGTEKKTTTITSHANSHVRTLARTHAHEHMRLGNNDVFLLFNHYFIVTDV